MFLICPANVLISIERVFNTSASYTDIAYIESFFHSGAFLDSAITVYVVDVASKSFTSTMVYIILPDSISLTTG